jgi:hypothetical protein
MSIHLGAKTEFLDSGPRFEIPPQQQRDQPNAPGLGQLPHVGKLFTTGELEVVV